MISSLMHSYLLNRWHRTYIDTTFSSWVELTKWVPLGSALAPLLLNIYLNDLFYLSECTEVCNLADSTTFYACDKELLLLIDWNMTVF